MGDTTGASDVHLSRVVGWALNTLGKAIAISMLASFVASIIGAAVASDTPALAWVLPGLAGPLTFAVVLYLADAPLPYPDDELVEDGEPLPSAAGDA